ncbi:MAG: hypothetical protein WDA20_11450 [Desulfuromonadales bacterium]|jgi:hypothetical protein
MNIEAFCRQLAIGLSTTPPHSRLAFASREIALFFDVQPHEIGLFQIDPRTQMTILRSPQSIGRPAAIPIQSVASSLVIVTQKERRGRINNEFSSTPHLHMVEHTLAEREQRIPVQKIMSAPIIAGDEVSWVVQVTRKGKTRDEAGPDFTASDLECLENITRALAGLF